jgi:acetyltransferase-like isoleucine patch superfamily enzyme
MTRRDRCPVRQQARYTKPSLTMSNIFFDPTKLRHCGKNVIIGKTVRIRRPEECIIGDNTIIDDFAYISCPIEVGSNCHIASHVSISGGSGKFRMGDYSTISNHCSVHCASSDYSKVSLDLPSVPRDMQFGGVVGDIRIGSYVTVGAHSCILPGVDLPCYFACGAYTLLTKQNYLEKALYVGIPARLLKMRDLGPLEARKHTGNS